MLKVRYQPYLNRNFEENLTTIFWTEVFIAVYMKCSRNHCSKRLYNDAFTSITENFDEAERKQVKILISYLEDVVIL